MKKGPAGIFGSILGILFAYDIYDIQYWPPPFTLPFPIVLYASGGLVSTGLVSAFLLHIALSHE